MERLEIVKNPFDPSLKAGASSSRLNEDNSTIPGMNPPAPESGSSAAGGSKQPGAGGAGGAGGPDYAALLQYLQYYQKALGPEEATK